MSPVVAVYGSLNMDFLVSVDQLPTPGETLLGSHFQMLPGGKGANQAVAAARLGASHVKVRMAGRVGYDLFADHLKASLSAAGVDVSAVQARQNQPTGVALITVDRSGQNTIIVAPGANHAVRPEDAGDVRKVFRGASHALFQLEVPLDSVAAALAGAKAEGCRTMLDPAPAPRSLPEALLGNADILTPNESEACQLLGQSPSRIAPSDAESCARRLHQRFGIQTIVLKLGDQGSYWWTAQQQVYTAPFPVNAVDATAAGDTFNGALAASLAEQMPIAAALRFASAAAALSTTKAGAQQAIPTRAETIAFLQSL